MAIGKGETTGCIMVIGGLIDPTALVRIEIAGVIDAVWMLVEINPGFRRARVDEIAGFADVFVNAIKWAGLSVAITDADIAGNASDSSRPASLLLRGTEIVIGGTF